MSREQTQHEDNLLVSTSENGLSRALSQPGVKAAITVNIVLGMLYGISIGVLPVALATQQVLAECSSVTAQNMCDALSGFSGCVWVNNTCVYSDYETLNCSTFPTKVSCSSAVACVWKNHDKKCVHSFGWDASQQGLLAGIYVVGSIIVSFFTASIADRLGRRAAVFITGVFTMIANVLFAVGWEVDDGRFALIVASEVVIGIVAGLACIVAPLYLEIVTDPKVRNIGGVFCQVGCTVGSLMPAIIAFIVQPQLNDRSSSFNLKGFQIVIGIQWLFGFLCFPLAFFAPESIPVSSVIAGEDKTAKAAVAVQPSPPLFSAQNKGPLIIAFVIAMATQLTGINAVVVFCPTIISNIMGLSPLLANLLVEAIMVLAALPAPFVERKLGIRRMFINGCALATLTCALTGIGAMPTIIGNKTVKNVVSCLGIATFLISFQSFIGTSFYPLTADIWPNPGNRSEGCAFAVFLTFASTLLLNWGFPASVIAFSGGINEDQNQGIAVTFFIFSAVGLSSFVYLKIFFVKTQTELERETLEE